MEKVFRRTEYVSKIREKVKEDPRIKYHPLLENLLEKEVNALINAAIYKQASDRIAEAVQDYTQPS